MKGRRWGFRHYSNLTARRKEDFCMLFLRHNLKKRIFKKSVKLSIQLEITPAEQE